MFRYYNFNFYSLNLQPQYTYVQKLRLLIDYDDLSLNT